MYAPLHVTGSEFENQISLPSEFEELRHRAWRTHSARPRFEDGGSAILPLTLHDSDGQVMVSHLTDQDARSTRSIQHSIQIIVTLISGLGDSQRDV